jgi:hypothetical protein
VTGHEAELIARRVAELVRPEEPWLSKTEVAKHFSCSTRSVEIAMRDGLPYRQLFGRSKFRASEVQAWLDGPDNHNEWEAND